MYHLGGKFISSAKQGVRSEEKNSVSGREQKEQILSQFQFFAGTFKSSINFFLPRSAKLDMVKLKLVCHSNAPLRPMLNEKEKKKLKDLCNPEESEFGDEGAAKPDFRIRKG